VTEKPWLERGFEGLKISDQLVTPETSYGRGSTILLENETNKTGPTKKNTWIQRGKPLQIEGQKTTGADQQIFYYFEKFTDHREPLAFSWPTEF
jgi:hypothetical protein